MGWGLLLRMVLALGLVLLLMWAAARVLGKVNNGRSGGVIELLARQPVGRTSSVAVVRVADRALVVGVTEGKVTLLTEADLDYIEAQQEEERERQAALRSLPTQSGGLGGALAGSILAPSTWRQTMQAIKDRTARRG